MPKKANVAGMIDLQAYKERQQVKEANNSKDGPETMDIAAELLAEYHFILIGSDERAPLAVYLDDEGIYTTSQLQIESRVLAAAPDFSLPKLAETIKKIKIICSVKYRKELTQDPNLIAVKNGVFDREANTLRTFSPEYIFTSKIETAYNADVKEPVIKGWKPSEWLLGISDYDKQVYKLMWQVIAAAVNGNYSYHQAIFLKGRANAGKGTFQQLVTNIDGPDNVASLQVNHFSDRFSLAALEGKTVCIGDDLPAGIFIDDSSSFNSVVTGDTVSIERKNKDPYSRQLNLTIIQSTNEMPKFRNRTGGTMRRLIIVPFKHSFTAKTENRAIKEDYLKRQEVCEWFLKEALKQKFTRFTVPDVVKEELDKYQRDNDPVTDFVKAVFYKHNPDRIPIGALYEYYKSYAFENGFKAMGKRSFSNQLREVLDSYQWDFKTSICPPGWHFDEFDAMGDALTKYDDDTIQGKSVRSVVRRHRVKLNRE